MSRPLLILAAWLAAEAPVVTPSARAAEASAPGADTASDEAAAAPAPPPADAPSVAAPGDAPANAATEGAVAAPSEPPSDETPTAATPGASAGRTGRPIVGFQLTGSFADRQIDLLALLRAISTEGQPFVESGPADQVGTPLGTIPRMRQAMGDVGYDAIIETKSVAGGLLIVVHLRPYDRVRYIYVKGNWPIRQDEIQRRISIRPGRALPLAGPGRDEAMEQERERLIQFLRSEGYFDANVRIDLEPHGESPAAVDLVIHVSRGPGYPVGPITVTGNTVFPSPDIEAKFRHVDWRKLWTGPTPFTVRRLREDIANVVEGYHDEGFPGARVNTSYDPERSLDRKNKNVGLEVVVTERKRISVTFEGNRKRAAADLKDDLTLNEHGAYDDYEADASADALQKGYQENGYFFARVTWRRLHVSDKEDRLTFIIDEGPQLKVRRVEFVGNKTVDSETLAGVVTVKPFPLLGYIGLGGGGYLTARQVQLDAERLTAYYNANGYPDAHARGDIATNPATFGMLGAIAASAETSDREANGIYVRFTVDEGQQVRVGRQDFRSVTEVGLPYAPNFFRDSITLRAGAPYRPGLLREDGRRIERLMGDAGFPNAKADPDIQRVGNAIAIVWKINPGTRVRVGPIFVKGNFVTQDQTILEQIPIRSGDYLTTTAFERGQRNLNFLQLFNNAAPIRFPGKDSGQAVVPMVVEVEERHDQYNVVHVGGGISTEQRPPDSSFPVGAYVRVGYDNRNMFGHGWTLSSSAAYGTSLLRATASFLDRRFMGTLFRFDIQGQFLQQATVRLGDTRSWGGSIGFSRELYPGVDAGIHYNLRNTTYTEPLLRSSGPEEAQRSVTLGTTAGSLSFNIQWLRLDNRLIPTRGFKIEATAEVAPRSLSFGYADTSFIKAGVHSTVVVPLLPWLSLIHGVRFDQGIPLGGEPLLPKVERYFAGGDTTLRGYKLDRARVDEVRLPFAGDAELVQYRPIGGNLRILQNIDLQFPIAEPWFGAVFLDNGVVADSLDQLGATQFRHGVGIAPLIIKLPVGDLSFAWAWPLDPRAGDTKIGVLHVNIGLLF